MDIDGGSAGSSLNVVDLSQCQDDALEQHHRCHHTCQIQHVWANLYRCLSSGITHVCDKNCNQKILYDNHSSICVVSRQFFSLTTPERELMRGLRIKRARDGSETCGLKRQSLFRHDVQMAVPASGDFCHMNMS